MTCKQQTHQLALGYYLLAITQSGQCQCAATELHTEADGIECDPDSSGARPDDLSLIFIDVGLKEIGLITHSLTKTYPLTLHLGSITRNIKRYFSI